jgi:hypothetical protein
MLKNKQEDREEKDRKTERQEARQRERETVFARLYKCD